MRLRIGSRGSPLARIQTEGIARELKKNHPTLEIEFCWITTTADKRVDVSLESMGGKGVFVKEIEEALLKNEIDLAVHSLKDVPQTLPAGLMLGPFPKREDPRDALISRFGEQLHELPRGSTIGTSSPRRQAQIMKAFKNRYRVAPIRGNVDTRLKKVHAGDFDAVIMALAGLKRLGLEREVTQILEPEQMLPAIGQGCLALELRIDDSETLDLISKIKDQSSDVLARAERAFVQALGGDCFTPVAELARLQGNELVMEALLLHPSGQKTVHAVEKGPATEAELVGAKLAGRVLMEGGAEILIEIDQAAREKKGSTA